MRSNTNKLNKLQKTELAMLKDLNSFCKENNIEYFLGEGTLLGAIRHQGFIPWDDDVDVLMKRPDYERFIRLAPKLYDKKYEIQHSTTIKDYWSPIVKIRLINCNDPSLRQQHISHLTKNNGPVIDVFPLDYVPRARGLVQYWQYYYIMCLRRSLSLKLGLKKAKGLIDTILMLITRSCEIKTIHEEINKTIKFYGEDERDYIALYSTYHGSSLPIVEATTFAQTIEVDFEDGKYPVPQGYDVILTRLYGDYMTPPKESECRGSHFFGEKQA